MHFYRGWQILTNAATFGILDARKFSICNRPRCAHLAKKGPHLTYSFLSEVTRQISTRRMNEFGARTHEILAVNDKYQEKDSILSLISPHPIGNSGLNQ